MAEKDLQSLLLYGHRKLVNPVKIAIILRTLDVPFEWRILDFPDMKQQPYLDLNPNGRVPTVVDPNTGITLWESGAVTEYLVDQYDKEDKFSFLKIPRNTTSSNGFSSRRPDMGHTLTN